MAKWLKREVLLLVGGILLLSALSWTSVILNIGPVMGMPSLPIEPITLSVFVIIWTVGMIAMMFPTAVPMLMMFLHVGRSATEEVKRGGGPTITKALVFVGTYLSLWMAMGVVLYITIALVFSQLPLEVNLFTATSTGVGAALVLVAAYQFSPMKGECLNRCHPTSFLYKYYKGGITGSARMGVDYAKYCIGCCWVMMAFLMISASMGVAWMATFAAVILAERALPLRKWVPRVFGLGFLASGMALILLG